MDDIKNLKIRYRNKKGNQNNIGDQFLRPCLNEFSRWRRCSLGFSLSALKTWAGSLVKIVKTENKKIEILCDIYSSASDKQLMLALEHCSTEEGKIEALRKYQENIIITAFAADQSRGESQDFKQKYGWKLLHYLIAKGQLEIKFAINTISDGFITNLYHEKAGYFEFPDGSKVGHEGSFNESDSGHRYNNESVSVYSSFRENDSERLNELIKDVDEDWIGSDSVRVLPLTPETLEIIKRNAPIEKPKQPKPIPTPEPTPEPTPTLDPIVLKRWEHQEKALNTFLHSEENEYSITENIAKRLSGQCKGILSMATGTGKTSTALRIAKNLLDNGKIDRIIIVPPNEKNLCAQWYETVNDWKFKAELNIKVFRHFGETTQIDRFLEKDSSRAKVIIAKREYELLNYALPKLDVDRTLIIHDEIHGLGTPQLLQLQGKQSVFKYTLGLSATPERVYDEEGTDFIFAEIGRPIFSYPLEDAIKNGTLCPFNYHEIKVQQSDETSRQISRAMAHHEATRERQNRSSKDLAVAIANIRAKDENKIPSLKYFLNHEKPQLIKNSIIFCATHEQGDEVASILAENGTTFTKNYRESTADQQRSLDELEDGRIDTVINCHTLSEGIDIRSLENIFILSSYRSKLETIQRVGRCLRIDPNNPNKIANVVDLVLYKDIESNDCIDGEKERKDWLVEVSKVRQNG